MLAVGFLVFALASDCVSLLLLKQRKCVHVPYPSVDRTVLVPLDSMLSLSLSQPPILPESCLSIVLPYSPTRCSWIRRAVWLHVAISLAMLPSFTILQLAPLSAPSGGVSDLEVTRMPPWQHQACAFGGLVLVTGASVAFAILPQKMKEITTPSPFDDQADGD